MIIDGDELKADPVTVMAKLQHFLRIEPFYDYKDKLRYDPRKGFFCQVTKLNSTKCLGRSKGRMYPPMNPYDESYLRAFYMPHNLMLSKLLYRLHYSIPFWLEEELANNS